MYEEKNETFFALDIGTRSIVGILGEKVDNNINIKHVAVEFHKNRVMYDGQVHDIEAVAHLAGIVKKRLEDESGIKLTNVAIAAAGRSLKSVNSSVTKTFEKETLMDSQIIKSIDLECLQEAANQLKENSNDHIPYFNVGHTVMTYKLDDYEIKNPKGHKGNKLSLEIIATFLPKIVIEALESVMKKIDLNISYITLEPIVAMEVVVPENARLLNIAMVDVGAGTSDVAITKDGTIVGYAMTATAGDEITEALSKNFLLDFDAAEKLKCNLNNSPTQTFTDIVGITTEMKTEDILEQIKDSIRLVANDISQAILEANGKSPSAVFLIGGGCQIPGLAKIIAENLELPEARVVIKTIENIKDISLNSDLLFGPQAITPVGILVCSIKNNKKDFVEVKVNDKQVKLFRSSELKISDALILAGFNPRDLISRKGKSLLLNINGKKKIISGKYGKEANILLNSNKANLDTKIDDDDIIIIEPATLGEDAHMKVIELFENKYIYLDDKEIPYIYNITVNSNLCNDYERLLETGDEINFNIIDSVQALRQAEDIDDSYDIYVNGNYAGSNYPINANDNIKTKKAEKLVEKVKSEKIPEKLNIFRSINVMVNNKNVIVKCNKKQPIFVDVFDFIDFDISKPNGRNLVLKHNNTAAEFTSPLKEGDVLEIYWE